jgi:hypothetical protein
LAPQEEEILRTIVKQPHIGRDWTLVGLSMAFPMPREGTNPVVIRGDTKEAEKKEGKS